MLHDGTLRGHAQVELRPLEGRRFDDDHGVGRRTADFLPVDKHLGRCQQFVDRAVADRPALVVPADHALHDRLAEAGLAGLTQWNASRLQQADDLGPRRIAVGLASLRIDVSACRRQLVFVQVQHQTRRVLLRQSQDVVRQRGGFRSRRLAGTGFVASVEVRQQVFGIADAVAAAFLPVALGCVGVAPVVAIRIGIGERYHDDGYAGLGQLREARQVGGNGVRPGGLFAVNARQDPQGFASMRRAPGLDCHRGRSGVAVDCLGQPAVPGRQRVEALHERRERKPPVRRVVGGCRRCLRRDRVIGTRVRHGPDAECRGKRDGDPHDTSDCWRRRMNQYSGRPAAPSTSDQANGSRPSPMKAKTT